MPTYDGINIQWPISELILSGHKTVETRTYPIPKSYLNKEVLLVETPGKSGNFKSRIRGIISFSDCFQYMNEQEFYDDFDRHRVDRESIWKYDSHRGKWGWKVRLVKKFDLPKALNRRTGIRYAKNLTIERT